ncbi:unnamed protein product [Angiostrongylus costaricensis]|uniref:PRP18 homolog n=1 Tax=Angiostrongylus costaricensis TaxID=334426 RepID=A0A158PEG5_ANGCS|nr:unnamed protein product [Angiostrongylus costaricensis]
MDVLKTLKEEVARKRKAIAEFEVKVDGKKFIRGADVVSKQEEQYWDKQRMKQAAKADSAEEGSSTVDSLDERDAQLEKSVADEIPMSEVRKRLRDRGQPIILFGESESQIRSRLLKLEIEQPDMKEGWKNEMQTAMRDVDEELVKEVIEGSSNDPNRHDVDLSSSFNDNWEKIEEQATLLGVGNDPHRDCDIILSFFKYLITRWGKELNKRDDEEKKSPAGIHQRPGSAKAYVSNIAHVLNDETQRKYIQAFKRLMTRMQEYFPTDPSKYNDVGNVEMGDLDEEELEDLDTKIASLKKQVSRSPYDAALNFELISLLRRNGDLDELAETRERIAAKLPLPSNLWIEWIEDERSSGAVRERIVELFEKAVFDSNSLDVWIEFVQWACGIDPVFARGKFEAAVASIGLRVDVGAMIWQAFLCFEEAILSGDETNEKQIKIVNSLYKRALRVPNIELAEIWKSYLEFAGEKVDEDIRSVYEMSTSKMKDYSKYELKLAESDDSIDAFCEYLNYEKDQDDPVRIQSFYERILDKHPRDESVWFDYGQWCETKLKVHSTTCQVYKRAVRHCPYSCALWQQTLLAMERAGVSETEIDGLWTDARETISSAEDGRALYRTYLYMLRRRVDSENGDFSKVAKVFEEGASSLIEWFGVHNWDHDGVYRRNWAYFAYTKLKDSEKGRRIWEDILASGGGRFAEKWIEAVKLERQFGTVERSRKLFYKVALNSVSDHPNLVFEHFIQFEREEGTLEQLDKALEKKPDTQKTADLKTNDRKRPAPDPVETHPLKKQAPTVNSDLTPKDKDGFVMPMLPVKKPTTVVALESRAELTESAASTAKEEKFTVFISNLDFKTTPEQIKTVLDGVVEVRLVGRGMSKLTKGFGYVDLDSEESYREALAKDRVLINGRPMLVSVNDPERRPVFKYSTGIEKSKLFVRNVHYACTEDQLREAFAVFGEVKAVRIVTHISGKPKGVAYVEFTSEEDAQKAINAPEIVLLDRKLVVAISNPPQKSGKTESSKSSTAPVVGTSTDRKASLSMVPRGVKTSSKKTMNGVDGKIVQMLHNASLLIDDIEDNSVLRRGLPVTHHIYGTPRTINAANYVYFIALNKCTLLSDKAVTIFVEQMLELHRGQGKELFWRDTVTCPTEAEYEEMVVQKTGGLFFLAVKLIELFSSKTYDFSNLLKQMALYFQIRDDYLNLVSDDMAKQKSFAEDLTEGKFSFPIIHAIHCSPTSLNDDPVLNILRQRTKDIEVKKYCIKLLKERYSFEYTLTRLRNIASEIREEIKTLGGNCKLDEVMDLLEKGVIN